MTKRILIANGASKQFASGDSCCFHKPAESIEKSTVRNFQAQPNETKATPNFEDGVIRRENIDVTGLDIPGAWIERADETALIARSEAKHICICYIHPELRIGDYCFDSGKGAKPLWGENTRARKSIKRALQGIDCSFCIR